jgi:hypothetical protein
MITDPSRILTGYAHNVRCAGHLSPGLRPEHREQTLKNILAALRHHEFDAIAFSGLSGALFAPMVAMQMDKTLLAVRRAKEEAHSSNIVEGDYNARRYVILDDMIAMGGTVRHILGEIAYVMPKAFCIGTLEYLWLSEPNENSVQAIPDWRRERQQVRPLPFTATPFVPAKVEIKPFPKFYNPEAIAKLNGHSW